MTPDKCFPVGTEVEVSQTDPDFQGSWYSGTVIDHTSTAAIVVEYKTLRENDDANARALREAVSPSQLRPIPPKGRQEQFGDGDSVDAYCNFGWWEGVITGVLRGDSRYVVFTRGWRDEMEFEGSMLRVHREWVKGRWVPGFDQENGGGSGGDSCGGGGEVTTDLEPPLSPEECMQNNKEPPLSPEVCVQTNKEPPLYPEVCAQTNIFKHTFSPGDLVEVSNEEEGLEGSWFAATILKWLNETKYQIEYLNLKDEDGKDPLIEEVDIQNLRPCPPELGYIDRFEAFERVDARYNDGWWDGIIRRVLKDDRYSVYFPDTDELLKFQQRDLRVHREWRNGKWVIPPKVSEF